MASRDHAPNTNAATEKEPLPPVADFFAEQLAEAQADPEWRAKWGQPAKGPVRILCDEIGFPWDPRLERTDILVAFVRGLVAEVGQARDMAVQISTYTGKPPSDASLAVLNLAEGMLAVEGVSALKGGALLVHEAADRLNPEDAYPTDHLIDMLSSCASAIRFAFETPCHSRHAASAAQHVWKHLYGVTRFDSHTPAWENDWARKCLQNAIISLLPVAPVEASPPPVPGEGSRDAP